MSNNATNATKFSKATRIIIGTVSVLTPFKGKDRAKQPAKGKDKDADKKKKAKEDHWPFYGVENDDDNDYDESEWSLVDIWEVEELEQEAAERADPLNVNVTRDLPPRVNYTQVTWEAFRDFMGRKKHGFRQIGW